VTAIAAAGKAVSDIEAALSDELRDFAAHPATAAEVEKARTQILAGIIHSREDPGDRAVTIAETAAVEGDPDVVNQEVRDLQRVTVADVNRAARKYLADAPTVTIRYSAAPPSPGAPASGGK
jgi:zinc protease